MAPTSSARWCPTPEQLMILEEMYRSGVRTPNATQIQQITSHLSFYGKIEGKNVFYWFQNHKARDRQKLRRKLTKQLQLQHQFYHHHLQPNHHPAPIATAASNPNFLHLFDSSSHPASPPAFQPLHQYYNSAPTLIPQVVGIHPEDASSAKQVMNYTWKFDHNIPEIRSPSVDVMDKAVMRMYGGDWMMMVDLGPPLSSPCYTPTPTTTSRPPLKTLELFPVTASNLKEDCNSNDNNNNCSNNNNNNNCSNNNSNKISSSGSDNKSPNNLSNCLGAPNNPTPPKPILALS